eukprot:UN14690
MRKIQGIYLQSVLILLYRSITKNVFALVQI